jgi:2-polyprenyl-3-methyl-5-hydroxy-6-metoxy-1,4-benzoquinol methylase
MAAVLSLGRTPLANALLTADQLLQPEAVYPLELVFCPSCSLVQITESVTPEELFRDYLYFSSYSETYLQHARTLANRLIADRHLGPQSLVIEIASNDGYLLQYYRQAGVPVLGIEPARNIAQAAQEKRQIPTLCEFFSRDLAQQLAAEGRLADVVHAHNVLAHVPDLNGFVAGLATLLRPGGVAVIEAPYLIDLIERCEFDTIYHEHLCYFSLTALDRLFRRHGLNVVDAERVAIHGGSLRLVVAHAGTVSPCSAALDLLQMEQAWGVDRPERYQDFAQRVQRLAAALRELLAGLKRKGCRIAAYGASAKGSTLLNYLALPAGTLEFVVDRSPVKQGRYTPGTHLPIYAAEKLLEEMPDHALLFTWNFMDEILQQQAAYRAQGGRFIVPLPEIKVV